MTSHLAAPHRRSLSAMAQTLLNRGLLTHGKTHLDYGCGRGGDVERLRSRGYQSNGYDPYYFPDQPTAADVVTMNYVINCIQDEQERREALLKAWALTRKHLIVAADARGTDNGSFSDRGVWTKSYSSLELRAYIETTLGMRSEPLAKDKFLIHRSGPAVTVRSTDEVNHVVAAIQNQGFVAPLTARVEPYRTKNSHYWRLRSQLPELPNGKKRIHLGKADSERYHWAIASIQRRNQIILTKFHCRELSFLAEFDYLSFPIINHWNCGLSAIETINGWN